MAVIGTLKCNLYNKSLILLLDAITSFFNINYTFLSTSLLKPASTLQSDFLKIIIKFNPINHYVGCNLMQTINEQKSVWMSFYKFSITINCLIKETLIFMGECNLEWQRRIFGWKILWQFRRLCFALSTS